MNQTIIAARLIQSSAHITAVTKDNSCFGSLEKISDRQFEKISGVTKLTWKQICTDSGSAWIRAFEGQYIRAKKKEDMRICRIYSMGGPTLVKK
jgi:hypothetical protein